MSPDTTTHAQRYCEGPCGRELAISNQPTLDDLLSDSALAPPHYRHPTVCVTCVDAGYTPDDLPGTTTQVDAPRVTPAKPKHPQIPLDTPTMRPCLGCDRDLNPPVVEPTLLEASTSDPNIPTAHPKHTTVCTDCIADGFRPPVVVKRRDAVIENCEFHVESGIGLTEAAGREGYSDRSHLDSVLRRWGRLDLAHALSANDPAVVRDRP